MHDGLGRMVRQVCDLRVGGTGAGAIDTSNPRNPDGQINLSYVFDGDSRLTGIVDDNGNRTSFGYDALSRRTSQTLADGSSTTFTFDKDDNVRTVTDSNGSVFTKQYDALNRITQMDVVRGLGVGGTKQQTFSYDGVSRLVRATDDNGSAIATQVCEWAFDSLGRMVEERQNGQAVSSRYSGDGKRTQVTYPSGRTITRGFDAIDRITSLADGAGVIAQSEFVGPGLRELRRTNRNGTALSFLNDAGNADIGFDAVQRLVRLRVLGAGGSAIVDREYAYNRASQRTSEKRNDDFGLTDTYTYDSAYRIVTSSFDQAGLPGATPRDTTSVSYVLDGVGNRRNVAKQSTSLGVVAESFVVNAVNEYASIQTGAAPAVTRGHDQNGNVTDDGTKLLTWDALNRLVGVIRKSDLRPIAMYRYLPDGRRSRKQVWNPDTNTLVKDVVSVWDGAQEVEEQVAGVAVATYVWSPVYVDELVSFTNASGTYYAHQDARCDVVAITNASGAVVERRRYDDFGREERLSGAGASGCEYGFQGRKLDAETGLWFFRARYYDPALGRFLSRDPVWDAGNVGGQYSFCGNGPGSGRDPGGLMPGVLEEVEQQVSRTPTPVLVAAAAFVAMAAPVIVPVAVLGGLAALVLGPEINKQPHEEIDDTLGGRPRPLPPWAQPGPPVPVPPVPAPPVPVPVPVRTPNADPVPTDCPVTDPKPQPEKQPEPRKDPQPTKKDDDDKEPRYIWRYLNQSDRDATDNFERIMPAGTGMDFLAQVRSQPTGFISAADSPEGAAFYPGNHGLAKIDVNVLQSTGSIVIEHPAVLVGVAAAGGSRKDMSNVLKADEVFILGGIHHTAIVEIIDH